MRAEPLQGGACAGGLGEARARGARWRAERGRGGVPGGEGVLSWGTVGRAGGEGGKGRGPGVRGREERKGREGGGKEREKKRKKMGKRKEKEKKEKGGERNKERKRGRGASASAPIAAAVGHAWRPGARERDARVEGKPGAGYGCRVFGESKDLAEQGSSRKNWG